MTKSKPTKKTIKPKKRRGSILKGSRLSFDSTLAIKILSKQDPILRRLIKRVGPFNLELKSIDSPFHALAESIVYQQLNGRAAATIFDRVHNLFDVDEFLCPHKLLETPEELLRSAGLSRSKLASIQDLATKTIEGLVPAAKELQAMDDDQIIERLTAIRGIGKWTVEMMLIFKLGRQDVLPVNDYGIRKGFALVYDQEELPQPKEIEEYGERWRPYRTVASWYLWRSLELKS